MRSTGLRWAAPLVLCAGDREFRMPLTREVQSELMHVFRAGLRQREIGGTQSAHRRHGLATRKNLWGVQAGMDWNRTREPGWAMDFFGHGVLQSIQADGILTRERVHTHRRSRNPIFTAACIMHGCGCPSETREHRFWHCRARAPARRRLPSCSPPVGIFLAVRGAMRDRHEGLPGGPGATFSEPWSGWSCTRARPSSGRTWVCRRRPGRGIRMASAAHGR